MWRSLSHVQLLILATIGLSCAPERPPQNRTVVVSPRGSEEQNPSESDPFESLRVFFEYYSGSQGFSREEVVNIITKAKEAYGRFFPESFSVDDYVRILFEADRNRDDRVTWTEILRAISDKSPMMRWLLSNPTPSRDELVQNLHLSFPEAGEQAVTGLVNTLMIFDNPQMGGDGDDRIQLQEISLAGVLWNLVDESKCTIDTLCSIKVLPGAGEFVPVLRAKLNRQLFGRYPVPSYDRLTDDEYTLESIQLGVKFVLVDRWLARLGHQIRDADEFEPLLHLTSGRSREELSSSWDSIIGHFDSVLFAGDSNGSLNVIESLNLLTELEFVLKWRNRASRLDELVHAFPRMGEGLFWINRSEGMLREDFWVALNKKQSLGELTNYWTGVGVLDQILARYDKFPADGVLSREECTLIFRDVGAEDPDGAVTAFFTGIPMKNGLSVFDYVAVFWDSLFGANELGPYDFYLRFQDQLPYLVLPRESPK